MASVRNAPAKKIVGRTGVILLDRTATMPVLYFNHVRHSFLLWEGLLTETHSGVNVMVEHSPKTRGRGYPGWPISPEIGRTTLLIVTKSLNPTVF